jgi:galactose mutarotase-like enzyme
MENDLLAINIAPHGAELTSIRDIRTGFEYLWQADPAVWGRHAPVLFPIVGKVKNNALVVGGKTYPMTQHGFARDLLFTLVSETATSTWYQLQNDAQTLAVFPFPFELQLGYKLEGNTLHCVYKITNTGSDTLYFSIGAHPGFNLPVADLSQYHIIFEQPETAQRQLLSEGLFNGTQKPVFTTPTHIQLSQSLFEDDAIVLQNLRSSKISLQHQHSNFRIDLQYEGFPYMGIWTPKNCEQYICLEPWCGHADYTGGHTDISTKAGIERLTAGAVFERTYSLTFTI